MITAPGLLTSTPISQISSQMPDMIFASKFLERGGSLGTAGWEEDLKRQLDRSGGRLNH